MNQLIHVFIYLEDYMTHIILEGLDKTGKSCIAELYKKQGYEVVHMSAPSKKYKEAGYAGPSYLDDIIDMLMKYDGKDVVFDRSWFGECVWPYIYNRDPMLFEDDIEVIQDFEDRNNTQKFLMIDPDTNAHWQRCVANKEPININQFKMATILFNKMAHKYNFLPKELKDFKDVETKNTKQDSATSKQEEPITDRQNKANIVSSTPISNSAIASATIEETELDKLEKANAIRDVLSKRILKQKGGTFDKLENDLKTFLKSKLSEIFSDQPTKVSLSEEETMILKLYCKQLKEKVSKK